MRALRQVLGDGTEGLALLLLRKGDAGRITPRIQHWNSLNNCSLFQMITVIIGCNTERIFYYAV